MADGDIGQSGTNAAPSAGPAPTVRTVEKTSERRILVLLGAVQFVNILDFMMVMPLGPDFARALHIPNDKLGLIGGSYTLAAAASGILSSRFLDRFDRRSALGVAMLGLVTATALGGFARGMASLMAARMLAGAFGGPATSLSLSIIADAVPPERRGKALGAVMGAFSVASVLGVPLGLELARLGSWRTPFLAVAGMGLVVAGTSIAILPSMRGHLLSPQKRPATDQVLGKLWTRPVVLLSWTMTAVVMGGNFALIPYISPYVQLNLGYPRERLGLLYMLGGTLNFIAMRLVGRLTDKIGEVAVNWIGTVMFVAVVFAGYTLPLLPVIVLFTTFMLTMAFRAVPMSTISSKVPAPWERAEFMSTQSAVQHLASAGGSILASRIVHSPNETAPLEGIPTVSIITIAMALVMPLLMGAVARRLPKAASKPPGAGGATGGCGSSGRRSRCRGSAARRIDRRRCKAAAPPRIACSTRSRSQAARGPRRDWPSPRSPPRPRRRTQDLRGAPLAARRIGGDALRPRRSDRRGRDSMRPWLGGGTAGAGVMKKVK